MYFTGRYEPREEARLNAHARPGSAGSEDRKFTPDVYDNATEGDLYFAKTSTAAERFYVPISAGEHGFDDEALLMVTHIKGKYGWHAYDAGGNLVVRLSGNRDLQYEALRSIESLLGATPLGRAIGVDAMRPVARALAEGFGLDWEHDYETSGEAYTVNPEDQSALKKAVIDLLTWAPQRGYADEIGRLGADSDRVGFAKDAQAYADLINGRGDGWGERYAPADQRDPLRLFSHPVSYAIAGSKDDGRSLAGRVEHLMKLAGVDENDLR